MQLIINIVISVWLSSLSIMATPGVCFPRRAPETLPIGPFPVWSLSTKGLHFDDPFARLISVDFVDLVDPRRLIMFLPPDLLTDADEEKVVARQEHHGRHEAAKLLLALVCVRGDWIPRLQQGLRHREIRLDHLADKIDALQSEVRMEIDFADHAASDMLMEVDSEPWPHTTDTEAHPPSPQRTPHSTHPPPTQPLSFQQLGQEQPGQGQPGQGQPGQGQPGQGQPSQGLQAPALPVEAQAAAPQVGFPELPRRLVSGRGVEEPSEPSAGQRSDPQTVLAHIAHRFFLQWAQSAQDVKFLTEQFERIATVLTTGYAVGCLEMRLRLATSRDLRQLRRLVESGVLQDTVEHALLSEEHCDWLRQEAAKYGMAWRQIKVKVTIAKDELDRCERFLIVGEEMANPRHAGEALLQKCCVQENIPLPTLPGLLLSFLHWILPRHPDLAQQVAPLLATSPLKESIVATMATGRRHFKVEDQLFVDLGSVAWDMLRSVTREQAEETFRQAQGRHEALERPSLYVEVPPESPLVDVVNGLVEAKLMVQHEVPSTGRAFRFVDVFVADCALSCIARCVETLPDDFVSKVLQVGSPFVMLHLLDFCLPRSEGEISIFDPKRLAAVNTICHQLLPSMADPIYPRALTDLYIASHRFLRIPDHKTLFQRCWWTFGWEWKCYLRAVFGSSSPDEPPDILLSPLPSDEMMVLRETGAQVLSARHTVDLTDKLTSMSNSQLRVLLACAQLTNVASLQLESVGNLAAVRVKLDKNVSTLATSAVQPALKLCKNRLEDRHVECLLDALPGLESVSHFDLSFCTITQTNLQCILSHLSMRSVKTLVLNGISFSDSRHSTLPKFFHLKKLQAVELSFLGLQDSDMPPLAHQICQLVDLRELTLEGNPITTEGLSQLTPALASCASLRALRLPGCQLDAGAAFVLGSMLTSAMSLHVLNLSRCPLTDSGLYHLSRVLGKHTALSKVSLREGGYSPPGLASFFSFLRTCQRMQHLELGECPVEEEGLDVSDQFLKVLAASCHWDFLGLWRCRIGHTSFLQQLGTLPTQLRGLTSLVLQDNDLGDTHVGHLAEAVRTGAFRHLKHLNLRQNTIGEAGAQQLADVLRFLPHLTELLMQHSSVPVDGAFCLARAVLHLPDMTLLDLSDSYGMGRYEVIDAVTKIERLVNDEGIVIGSGVGYTDGDSSVEEQSVAEQLGLFHLQDLPSGATRGVSTETRTEEKSSQSSIRVSKKPVPPEDVEGEGFFDIDTYEYVVTAARKKKPFSFSMPVSDEEYDDLVSELPGDGAKIPIQPPPLPPQELSQVYEQGEDVSEVAEDVYEDVAPVELSSPSPEESAGRGREERRRVISGRDRDTLLLDGVLRISLGHQ